MNESINDAAIYGVKFLEDMLSFFGLNLSVKSTIEDEVIQLNVQSSPMNGFLIGQKAENLVSFQYIVSMALRNNNFKYTRVYVDIADYKKHQAEKLKKKYEKIMIDVRDNNKEVDLDPMNSSDRRVVHQMAAEYGLSSESIGEGRQRHIVLKKLAD
jgi:spoIIIJ-associated protein